MDDAIYFAVPLVAALIIALIAPFTRDR